MSVARTRTVFLLVLLSAGALAGCGITDSEPSLLVSGAVYVQESDSRAGEPIEGARVRVVHESETTLAWADTDESGRFSLEVGAPPGYSYPNCYSMSVEAEAEGFQPDLYIFRFNGHDTCDDVRVIDGITLLLAPVVQGEPYQAH